MSVLNKLRFDSLKRLLIPILVLFLLGFGFMNRSNLFVDRPIPRVLSEVPESEMNGAYVTTDVDRIYACYSSTELMNGNIRSGLIVQRSYVIRANETQYIALVLGGSMMQKAQTLLAQSDEYYYGTIQEITAGFPVTGYLQPLTGEQLKLFQDTFNYDALSALERRTIRPYYLSPWEIPLHKTPLAIGILCVLAGSALLVLCLCGYFQRQIRRKEKQLNIAPDHFKSILEKLWNKWQFSAKAVFHEQYMLLRCGASHFLYDESDILCAYLQFLSFKNATGHTSPLRRNMPNDNPRYGNVHIVLEIADGTKKKIYFQDMEQCEILLQVIWGKYPKSYQE